VGAKVHRCCSCCGSDRRWSKERLVKAMRVFTAVLLMLADISSKAVSI